MNGIGASGSIPLSNIKRLFRSKFRKELSETSLGHAKLSELFQDPRLRDICTVRLQGHGYVVAPAAHPSSTEAATTQAVQMQSMLVHMQMATTAQAHLAHHIQPIQYVHPLPSMQMIQTSPAYNLSSGVIGQAPAMVPVAMGQVQQRAPSPPAAPPGKALLRDRARVAPLCLDDIIAPMPAPTVQSATQSIEASGRGQTLSPLSQHPGQALPRLLGNVHGSHSNQSEFRKQPQALVPQNLLGTPKGYMTSALVSPPTPEAWPTLLTPSTWET